MDWRTQARRTSPRPLAHPQLHNGAHGAIVLHRDVREAPKAKAGGAHLQLGLPLTVGLGAAGLEETFEDLDELLARYVEPLAAAAAALAAHRKFVDDADWARVKATLAAEFEAGGRKAPAYRLCPDYARPGVYYIGFVLPTASATPHREYLTLLPRGAYFRSAVHKSVDHAVGAFKRDPSGRGRGARGPGPGRAEGVGRRARPSPAGWASESGRAP